MRKVVLKILSIVLIFTLCTGVTFAAFTPYGGVNTKEYLYPKMVSDWYYDRGVYTESYDTPAFDGQHGSEKYGEIGWWTTHEEMISFLESLPTDRMKMEIVSEFPIKDSAGEYVETLKWPLLVFSKPSVFSPEDLHALGKPIVWLEGQIHGNENAPGEAMLVMAQKLASGEFDDYLDEISVVIVPRYNVDGAYKYQRGSDTSRPFQGNVDMNRDNTAFETPIVRLVHSLLNRYKPHVFLDGHEMGYGYNSQRIGSTSMGNEKFHTFDIATLAAPLINVPDDIKELAYRFEDNVVTDMNAAGLGNHFYWYTEASKTIEAEVYDYRTGQMTTGTKTVPTAIKEGNPDEGITDPSVALLPAISVLFESRAPQTTIDRLPRVHGHVMAATSILNSAANYASEIMEKIEAGRQEFIDLGKTVSEDDEIVIWSNHSIIEDYEIEGLTFTEDRSALEITTDKVTAYRVKNMTPALTTVRPRAYIISGDLEDIGPVVERLSYTGAKIERLCNDEELEVEAQIIESIGRPADAPDRSGSAMSGITSAVNATTTIVKNVAFPKDTFVVHMDQTAGTHAALSLEPLGNRSYANYWLSRSETGTNQSGPHGGKTGFIPAIQGEEFQVYRYMGDERLNTYPIILDHPFVDNTMVKQLYPLTDEEINDFIQLISKNKNSEVNYLNHFQILQPFGILEVVDNSEMPPGLQDMSLPSGLKNRPLPSGLDKRLSYRMSENAFRLLLPKSIDRKSLDNQDWYLYDWSLKEFKNIDKSYLESENWIIVSDEYISDDYEVIVAAGKE